MLDSEGFVCKKFLNFKSDLGMTLYWLKAAFSEQIEDPIASAICNVYLPSVLAKSSEVEDKTRFPFVHEQSCSTFERWMKLALEGESLNSPCNSRFRINFCLSLDSSDVEKTLKWLHDKDATNLERNIFEAIRLMFLPIALSAFKRHRVPMEIEKARLIFRRRVGAGSPCFQHHQTTELHDEQSNIFIAQSVITPQMEQAIEHVAVFAVPVQEQKAVQNGSVIQAHDNTPKLDLDYDF